MSAISRTVLHRFRTQALYQHHPFIVYPTILGLATLLFQRVDRFDDSNSLLAPTVLSFTYFNIIRFSLSDVAWSVEFILLRACCLMNELNRRLEKLIGVCTGKIGVCQERVEIAIKKTCHL